MERAKDHVLVCGGPSETVAPTDPRNGGRFLDGSVQSLIDRGISQLTEIERHPSSRGRCVCIPASMRDATTRPQI